MIDLDNLDSSNVIPFKSRHNEKIRHILYKDETMYLRSMIQKTTVEMDANSLLSDISY